MMEAREWGVVYEPRPLGLDVLFLIIALGLHVPLLLLHMNAPQKTTPGKRASRLVNIDYIEQKAKERQAKAASLPAGASEVEIKKKMEEIREKLLKKAVPLAPVVPKAEIQQKLATAPDPSKIQMDMKSRLEQQNQKLLESKKNFTDKNNPLAGASGPKEIKMGGGVTAIQMGPKTGIAGGGAAGPVLKGKSGGFAVADKSMPASIVGGDEGGIKMDGGAAIVVHTGSRAGMDKNILSSVATVKDKGSLQGKGNGAGGSGPAGIGGPSGLALGPGGGGGSIALSGGPRGPSVPLPAGPAVSGGRSFSENNISSPPVASGGIRTGGGAGLPDVGALVRHARAARSMFQITGPLQNRTVVSQVLPEYPDWARAKGITAAVSLQITVSPDGTVKSTIIVLRTSGYPQLDEVAMDALRQWRFAPLPGDELRDEVGAVTMNFSAR